MTTEGPRPGPAVGRPRRVGGRHRVRGPSREGLRVVATADDRRFIEMFPGSGRWGFFVDGRLVCDYRPSGEVYRVRLFFPLSEHIYQQSYCADEDAARLACQDLAAIMEEARGRADD